MDESFSLKRIISSRQHIREFSEEFSEKCGKSPKFIEKDIISAKKMNHISFGEYEWFEYWKLNDEQKKSISTLWTRAQFRKTFTDRRYICILMNKYIFSKVFADFYGRKCYLLSDITPQLIKEIAEENNKIVYKPNCKGQGKGVRIIPTGTEEEFNAAWEFLKNADNGIVEEFICQHEVLNHLNPGAVSIIRFYSVCPPSGSYIFAPVLTTAMTKSISNGCQDALTAMIDIRTGEVITDAVDQNHIVDYPLHPVTGVPFKGIKIPYWEETLDMMRRALPLASKISNIGWDVAITETGPVLVEANTIPGFNTAQYSKYSWITEGYGYQPLFDEAFGGEEFRLTERYEKVVIKV